MSVEQPFGSGPAQEWARPAPAGLSPGPDPATFGPAGAEPASAVEPGAQAHAGGTAGSAAVVSGQASDAADRPDEGDVARVADDAGLDIAPAGADVADRVGGDADSDDVERAPAVDGTEAEAAAGDADAVAGDGVAGERATGVDTAGEGAADAAIVEDVEDAAIAEDLEDDADRPVEERVRRKVAAVDGIAGLPLSEHAQRYDEVHAELQAALTEIDGESG